MQTDRDIEKKPHPVMQIAHLTRITTPLLVSTPFPFLRRLPNAGHADRAPHMHHYPSGILYPVPLPSPSTQRRSCRSPVMQIAQLSTHHYPSVSLYPVPLPSPSTQRRSCRSRTSHASLPLWYSLPRFSSPPSTQRRSCTSRSSHASLPPVSLHFIHFPLLPT